MIEYDTLTYNFTLKPYNKEKDIIRVAVYEETINLPKNWPHPLLLGTLTGMFSKLVMNINSTIENEETKNKINAKIEELMLILQELGTVHVKEKK